jgi:hypothetical protein
VDDWIANKEPAEGSRETVAGEHDQSIGQEGREELASRDRTPRDQALREQPEGEASGGTSVRPSEAGKDPKDSAQ